MIPKPLRDTITLLRNNGVHKEGYDEACASAIEQVTLKAKRGRPNVPEIKRENSDG